MALPRFNIVNAESIEQAAELLKAEGKKAKAIGGGTDLLHGFKDNIYCEYPETIVNLRTAAGGYIREEADGVHIGAMTTVHEIEKDGLLQNGYSVLAQAAATVASPQIRNVSTIGGNICQEPRCWYYRNADSLFCCLRKGGVDCPAFAGRNDIHSIFGAGKACDSPCEDECPNGTPIPRYFEMIRKGDVAGAAKLFLESSPLAAMTGRVCPHTCENVCNRGGHDEEVSIRDIERYIGDYTLEHSRELTPEIADDAGKKVAIIGSGPAGLTAAWFLGLAGVKVVVFDKNELAGGMLVYGIPAYRLPKDLVEKNVRMIADIGVEFRQGVSVGTDLTLEHLRADFDAVLICNGAWISTRIGCKGDDANGVIGGIDFLYRLARREDTGVAGKTVAVIGGGNTAMDACRSAKRLGAQKVYNFYRRSRAEMPADEIEIEEAAEEGVEFRYLAAPAEIISENGKVKKLVLQQMELGEPDASGRRRPVPVAGAFETIDIDVLISAVGQGVDPAGFETAGLTERQWIAADSKTYRTCIENVFAAGDGAQGPDTAITAIAHARKAAASIIEYLGLRQEPASAPSDTGLLTFDKGCAAHSQKMSIPGKPVTGRTLFDEDIKTASSQAIREEAGRCFDCGCVASCPSDLAPALVALNARIVTTDRSIDADDFFAVGVQTSTRLREGELVKEIVLPKPESATKSVYLKYRHRKAIDFPLFSAAVVLSMNGNRVEKASIVLGAAAPVPLRAKAAEKILLGKDLTEPLADAAAEEALKGALPLDENGYKVSAAKAYIRRAIVEILG